jgi:hypothetical protein
MTRFETPHRLQGCQLKLDRAYEHIETLHHAIQGFLRRNPHEPIAEIHVQPPEYVAWMKVRENPPLRWGIIVGEIIHDLRSALDHLVHQLALTNGKAPGGISYPVLSEDPGSPKASDKTRSIWRNLTKRIHPDDLAIIERTQPYNRENPGVGRALFGLNRLSNWDKHNAIHLSASFLADSRFGFEAIQDVELGTTEFGHVGTFENGTVVAVCPCRFTGPNPKVKMNAQLAYGVAFLDGPPGVKGKDVVLILMRLANFVHDILLKLGSSPRFDQNDSASSTVKG